MATTISKNRKVAVPAALKTAILNCDHAAVVLPALRPGSASANKSRRSMAEDVEVFFRQAGDQVPGYRTAHHLIDYVAIDMSDALDMDVREETLEAYIKELKRGADLVREWQAKNQDLIRGKKNRIKAVLLKLLGDAPKEAVLTDTASWRHVLAETHLIFGITEKDIEDVLTKECINNLPL